jgi:sugar/nucleoside kinase (ribokinase family)
VSADLVCAGEAFEDIIFHELEQWPRLGEEFKTDRMLRTWGGGALLTAVAAAAQGVRGQVLSLLAPAAVRFLRKRGLSVRNLKKGDEPHALTVALSTLADRAFVTYPGANSACEERILEVLPSVNGRHVHLALEPAGCLAWLAAVHELQARGISTSWDFGWNPALLGRAGFLELSCALDYLFLNQKEALLYSGCETEDEALAFWASRARCAVIKLSERGCVALQGGLRYEAAGVPVKAVDSTGAGDAFNGGFLAGLLQGRRLEECLLLGNQVGAASTLQPGGLLP